MGWGFVFTGLLYDSIDVGFGLGLGLGLEKGVNALDIIETRCHVVRRVEALVACCQGWG